MEVCIEGQKEFINLSADNLLDDTGKDGIIYRYKDKIIKINISNYMTYEVFEDLLKAKESYFASSDRDIELSLVMPLQKVFSPLSPILREKITPLYGYTEKYVEEDKDGFANFTPEEYIKETLRICRDVKSVFTANNIALTDTNPKNILIGPNHHLFLIDFDRCITPNCTEQEKENVYNGDYNEHNTKRLRALIYKVILSEVIKYMKKEKIALKGNTLQNFNNELLNIPPLESLFEELQKYDVLGDYVQEKTKALVKTK